MLTLWVIPRGQFRPIFHPKNGGFFINYITIPGFLEDLRLVLFDSSKDVAFWKIFVFDKILGFLEVNWTQKWTKTINFGHVPFPPKYIILKDFSHTAFSYKIIPLVKVSAKSSLIWGRKNPEFPPKGPFHG